MKELKRKIEIVKCIEDIIKNDEWREGNEGENKKKRIMGMSKS